MIFPPRFIAALLATLTVAHAAPSCEAEARAWRSAAKQPQRVALEGCIAHVSGTAASAGRLAFGVSSLEAQRFEESLPFLQKAKAGLAPLEDYLGFFLATAYAGIDRQKDALAALEPVWRQKVPSPITGRAAVLAAKSYIASGRPAEAVTVLERNDAALAQPQGDAVLAEAWVAAGQPAKAAAVYARIYFRYPQSPEASAAGLEWKRLGQPDATPQNYLLRAERCSAAQATAVRIELLAASAGWSVADRELAQVRAWVADYRARRYADARAGLLALKLTTAEADSERMYHLYQIARRLDRDSDRDLWFQRLNKQHPDSPWNLEALYAEGHRLLNDNDFPAYEPIFQSCVDRFATNSQAAVCHWKVAWSAYIRRRPDAASRLRDHLQRFPQSEKANTAIYFLGRIEESQGNFAAARAYYDFAVDNFPNTYYALISAQRRTEMKSQVAAQPETKAWLQARNWPKRGAPAASEVATAAARRERSNLLAMAGLDLYAEAELRTGAREEKAQVQLAMDLAEFMSKVGQADKGLRYIKGLLPGYLFFPWETTGDRFWKLAFPLPFQRDVELYASQNGLDPYIVAGLIRQESEFNPKVVSYANAHGLTQIMPATGRELSRRLGMPAFQNSMLFDPATNLKLGTFYLKTILAQLGGRWEDTLAGYNAGPSRAVKWRKWADYTEPAEFIETIPFDQTRDYVQSVLRNAAVYRKLYANQKPVGILAANEPQRVEPVKPRVAAKPLQKRKKR